MLKPLFLLPKCLFRNLTILLNILMHPGFIKAEFIYLCRLQPRSPQRKLKKGKVSNETNHRILLFHLARKQKDSLSAKMTVA